MTNKEYKQPHYTTGRGTCETPIPTSRHCHYILADPRRDCALRSHRRRRASATTTDSDYIPGARGEPRPKRDIREGVQ